jgi:hypothetical protein
MREPEAANRGPPPTAVSDLEMIKGVLESKERKMTIKTLDTDEKSVDGQPHYMRSLVFLDDTGHLQVRTNTYSHVWFVGFHGGIVVTLTDRSGKLLYATPATAYGVDGSAVPFGTANRWDTEDYNVGATVAQQTDRIDVLLFRAADTNLAGFLKTLGDIVKAVEDVWAMIQAIIQQIGDAEQSGEYTGSMETDGPTQVTEDALTGVLGTLIAAVNPAALAYGQQVTFTVTATDSTTGAAVSGLVYKSLSLPLTQGASLLGSIGQPITATISGQWSVRPRLVEAQPNPSMTRIGARGAPSMADIGLARPEFGKLNEATSIFAPENLYVRTKDYGDVAVPFVLTGRPDGSN